MGIMGDNTFGGRQGAGSRQMSPGYDYSANKRMAGAEFAKNADASQYGGKVGGEELIVFEHLIIQKLAYISPVTFITICRALDHS